LAVIAQGIAARAAKGQASSALARAYGQMFKPIAEIGLEIVDAGELSTLPKSKL
jgi:hypothetical protein